MARISKIEAKVAFIQIFLEKLGDVSKWEHFGTVDDFGAGSQEKCVCGHLIRYGYLIMNSDDDRLAYVGSECINHFKDYNLDLYNSLIATIEKAKEGAKAIKIMQMNAEVSKAKDSYLEKLNTIRKFYYDTYGRGYCSNYELWYAVTKVLFSGPSKKYKSQKALLNWYRQYEEKADFTLKHYCN